MVTGTWTTKYTLSSAGLMTVANAILSGLTASRLVFTNASKQLESSSSNITSSELETLSDTSNADLLHAHAHSATTGKTTDDHHPQSHDVSSHTGFPVTVDEGGTGLATLADGGLLLGSGTGAVTPLAQATNGQLPIGSTGADPVLATVTGTANQIAITNAAGSITVSTPQDIHAGASAFTMTGLVFNTVPSLPGTVVAGKVIRLATDDRLYYGKVS